MKSRKKGHRRTVIRAPKSEVVLELPVNPRHMNAHLCLAPEDIAVLATIFERSALWLHGEPLTYTPEEATSEAVHDQALLEECEAQLARQGLSIRITD